MELYTVNLRIQVSDKSKPPYNLTADMFSENVGDVLKRLGNEAERHNTNYNDLIYEVE